MNRNHALVLFDFDGTLTTRDTLFSFTRFAVGNFRFRMGMLLLAFHFLLFRLNFLSAHKVKEVFLHHFFSGMNKDVFSRLCKEFAHTTLPGLIRPKALEVINENHKRSIRMIIVSASMQDWIQPWADLYNLEVIATRLEIAGGKITGKIAGANCNGYEKVKRLKQAVDLHQYPEIIAYGDTPGDLPMLALATQKFYKPFLE